MHKTKATPTGFWLHPSGLLGASPHGLVDKSAIIEIKCPLNQPLLSDKQYCFDTEGNFKKNHAYYHQIQGQLSILNKSVCYFLVWTTVDTLILQIQRDFSWEST